MKTENIDLEMILDDFDCGEITKCEAIQKIKDLFKAGSVEKDDHQWNVGDKFTTPETGDKIFTVTRYNKYDVEALDYRSRSGFTIFSKSYIKKVVKSKPPINTDLDNLRKSAEPLIKYLSENFNPHHTCIVTSTSVELLECKTGVPKI